MAKGLKMYRARNASGEIVAISQAMANQSLSCEGCGAPISYVSPYSRGGGKIKVAHHLRLAKGNDHNDDCKYTLEAQLRYLSAIGNDIDVSRRPLSLLANGKYRLRLNIIHDRFKEFAHSPRGGDLESNRARTAQVWSGDMLAPYCRTAAGLARIAELLEDDFVVRRRIEVTYRASPIDWSHLYFGEGNAGRLVRYLRSARYTKSWHPVALLVRPKIRKEGHLQCYAEEAKHNAIYVVPRICAQPHLLSQLDLDRDYLVFGQWFASSELRRSSDGKVAFDNIQVEVHQKAQFCPLLENWV